MNLFEAKLNANCIIKAVEVEDEKTKIRLMELGLIVGTRLVVKYKSIMKKTLIIFFNSSCFTLKDNLAKKIVVNYA
ncbi:MAG: ferrous iron transport protein A [Clostridia bacterium]|nr:ferrous iron transport protein A [Clostridia bacterium]